MGDNLIVMIVCAAAGGGFGLIVALALSATIRRRGIVEAIHYGVSRTERMRNPYRG